MDFELVSRGYGRVLALVPGWGFCADIFSRLALPYDYVLPVGPVCGDISEGLFSFMARKAVENISILGWSMGAFIALDFVRRHPRATTAVFLVSLRTRFDNAEILGELAAVREDRLAALRRFYRRCFLGQRSDYQWFSSCLEESTMRRWDLDRLQKGLRYLEGTSADLSGLAGSATWLVHGERDTIAPLCLAPRPPSGISIEVLKGTGHLPFLSPEFERRFPAR
jgi:pimeloyl-ACP methyl ester carboxylesterase